MIDLIKVQVNCESDKQKFDVVNGVEKLLYTDFNRKIMELEMELRDHQFEVNRILRNMIKSYDDPDVKELINKLNNDLINHRLKIKELMNKREVIRELRDEVLGYNNHD